MPKVVAVKGRYQRPLEGWSRLLAPPGRGGFAGDLQAALLGEGAGTGVLFVAGSEESACVFGVATRPWMGQGLVRPGQLGRNLRKVSPPHPLFQRALFPPAVGAGIGTVAEPSAELRFVLFPPACLIGRYPPSRPGDQLKLFGPSSPSPLPSAWARSLPTPGPLISPAYFAFNTIHIKRAGATGRRAAARVPPAICIQCSHQPVWAIS